MTERRRAGRRPLRSSIVIRTLDGGVAHGTIRNVALWGMLIELPGFFRVPAVRRCVPLILVNRTGQTSRVHRISARVTRRSEHLLALSFEAMTPETLHTLIGWFLSDDGPAWPASVSWQLWADE